MSRARDDAGFSLVEALVALGVFATAGVALVQLQAQSLHSLSRVERFALAEIVAQNELVSAMATRSPIALGSRSGEVDMASRRWMWETTVSGTADPAVARVTVRVREAGAAASGASEAHGFIRRERAS